MSANAEAGAAQQIVEGKGGPDAWQKVEYQFTSKRHSEFFDPCQDFANRSIKCLHRNGGDKEMCTDYFQYALLGPVMDNWLLRVRSLAKPRAYRDCKKEWTTRRRTAAETASKPAASQT